MPDLGIGPSSGGVPVQIDIFQSAPRQAGVAGDHGGARSVQGTGLTEAALLEPPSCHSPRTVLRTFGSP